jgi:putative nucleotidyltransferase with HDIG domain
MSMLAPHEQQQSRRVLVAVLDGKNDHREQVNAALTSFYRVLVFDDCDAAYTTLNRFPPATMVVDEAAPPNGGFAALKRLRSSPNLGNVPVVFTTKQNREFTPSEMEQMGVASVLVKPFRRSELLKTISSLVNRSIEAKWEVLPDHQKQCLRKTVDMFNGISDLIDKGEPISYRTMVQACDPLVEVVRQNDVKSLMASVRDHDNYSYVHSLRVATLLSMFGHAIGLEGDELTVLASGGLVHDIGKMTIPHEVLNKPGRLDDDELVVMRSHVDRTVEHLKRSPNLPPGIATIASQHHEKLDGTGYPRGLKGSQLNELARMASIVDVFSALTDRRVYKPPMEPEKALSIMIDEMGSHLDVKLLGQFRTMLLSAIPDETTMRQMRKAAQAG